MSATTSTQPIAATPEQPLWFIDNLAFVHVTGEQTGGALEVVEAWGARGDMPPLHIHHREEETFYVVEGQLTLFVADEEIVLTAGQAVVAPRGVMHVYRVDSEQAALAGDRLRPPASVQFVLAASEPAPAAELPPAGRPVDPARIAEIGARARHRDHRASGHASERGGAVAR